MCPVFSTEHKERERAPPKRGPGPGRNPGPAPAAAPLPHALDFHLEHGGFFMGLPQWFVLPSLQTLKERTSEGTNVFGVHNVLLYARVYVRRHLPGLTSPRSLDLNFIFLSFLAGLTAPLC